MTDEGHKGVTFDKTINLGHILTFVGFIVSGFVAWSTLDKRLVVVEQTAKQQVFRDHQQDERLRDILQDTKENWQDVRHSLDKLNDKLSERHDDGRRNR